jgi:5-formyltetrahydrofolate cyclo-ligase
VTPDAKALLRSRMRSLLKSLSDADMSARSALACARLVRTGQFGGARAVMLYLALPHELDCRHAIEAAWRCGKSVLVPRVNWSTRRIEPVPCRSFDNLTPGRYGLREPAGEPVAPGAIDMVVVPALAYDLSGRRLGRGGGFYDRFLASPDLRAAKCGFALAEQVLPRVPADQHDQRVDMLVTDRSFFAEMEFLE